MQRFTIFIFSFFFIFSSAYAANFNIKGSGRFSMEMFSNLNLVPGGVVTAGTTSDTKTYNLNRFLLYPEVLIDDHFSIFMEWNIRQYFSAAGTDIPPVAGTMLGNTAVDATKAAVGTNAVAHFGLTKAWLRWMTDWGILKIGRYPKDWGIGMVWDSGKDVWDDDSSYGSGFTYKAMLGNISMSLAYEKGNEGAVNVEQDDVDIYRIAFEYNSMDVAVDMGLVWERQVAPSASNTTGCSSSMHTLDLYLKKKILDFNIGFEFAYKTGEAGVDTNSDGASDSYQAIGMAVQAAYFMKYFSIDLTSGYATGDANPTDGEEGTMTFHKNFTRSLLLFREDLGVAGNTIHGGTARNVSIGSKLYDSGMTTFYGSGAFFMSTMARVYFFDKRLNGGVNFTWGFLASAAAGTGRMLGYETDIDVNYKWYDNFSTGAIFAFLVTDNAYASVVGQTPQNPWALMVNAALVF